MEGSGKGTVLERRALVNIQRMAKCFFLGFNFQFSFFEGFFFLVATEVGSARPNQRKKKEPSSLHQNQ